MPWLVEVQGDPVDLKALADAFSTGPVQVKEVEEKWYIGGDAVEAAEDAHAALVLAREHLPRLNGLGRAVVQGFQPITLAERVTDADNPGQRTTVFGEVHLTGRATLTVGGSPGAGVKTLDKRVASDPVLAEAIRILGRSEKVEWTDLYKVYEVLAHAARPAQAFYQRVGVTEAEARNFTYSANSPRASGDKARHAADKFQTAKAPPMTLDQGRAFIQRILSAW